MNIFILATLLGFAEFPTTPVEDAREFALEQYCHRHEGEMPITERTLELLEEFTGRTRENHSFENGLCYLVEQHYMFQHHVGFTAPALETFADPFGPDFQTK